MCWKLDLVVWLWCDFYSPHVVKLWVDWHRSDTNVSECIFVSQHSSSIVSPTQALPVNVIISTWVCLTFLLVFGGSQFLMVSIFSAALSAFPSGDGGRGVFFCPPQFYVTIRLLASLRLCYPLSFSLTPRRLGNAFSCPLPPPCPWLRFWSVWAWRGWVLTAQQVANKSQRTQSEHAEGAPVQAKSIHCCLFTMQP